MTTALEFRLNLPYDRPPKALTANTRVHWRQRQKDTLQVRSDVVNLAKQAGLHQLGPIRHLTVALTWAPGDRRRRDADNLFLLLKAACDALARGPRRVDAKVAWVGLDLVPDDTPAYMDKRTPFIAPPPAKGMWLDITVELDDGLSSSVSAADVPVWPVTAPCPSATRSGTLSPRAGTPRDTSTPTERTDR